MTTTTQQLVVAANSRVVTSPNSLTYVERNPFSSLAHAVVWSKEHEKFVAVSSSGHCHTSVDGINWVAGTSIPEPGWISSVIWVPQLNLYVAGGIGGSSGGGGIYTSSNGTSWVSRSSSFYSNNDSVESFAYSPSLGIIVAGGQQGKAASSTNGTSWTQRTTGQTGNLTRFSGAAWSPELGLFVMVGAAFTGEGIILTSTNGTSWTLRTSPAPGLKDVEWSPVLEIFVAVGDNGHVITSSDGINWSLQTVPAFDGTWHVLWSDNLGRFLISTSDGQVIASTDGVNWFVTGSPGIPLRKMAWSEIGNFPPLAPTLVTPVNNIAVNRAVSVPLTWAFNDPNVFDTQDEFELRYRSTGSPSWTTIGPTGSVNTTHSLAPNALATDSYEWQVRTSDKLGEWGPWSAIGFFSAANVPPTPTIVNPTLDETMMVRDYLVEWSAGVEYNRYQVRTVGDAGGSPNNGLVYFSSGEVISSNTFHMVSFLTNNRTEHVQVRIRAGGLWSEWASVRVDVAYTPPAVPVLTLTPESSLGRIKLELYNPPPSGGQPAAIRSTLLRRVAGEVTWQTLTDIEDGGTYYDYTVSSGILYQYMVTALGSNDAVNTSILKEGSIELRGSWIHDPDDPPNTIRQFRYNDRGGDETYQTEVVHHTFAGRPLPVAEFGEAINQQIAVQLTVDEANGDMEALQNILKSTKVFCYRDSYGRKIYFAPSGYTNARRFWGGVIPLTLRSVEYRETL